MKFRKKPVVIDAITFDEFVQYGKDSGANIVNGMPWSFEYNGHPVTHENDERYLIPTLEGTHNFTPDDMLITGVKGEIYPCKKDIFEATYDVVADSKIANMTFGLAIEELKKGGKVARAGWNGKGMWLSLSGPQRKLSHEQFWSGNNGDFARQQPDGQAEVLPCITMKTADDKILMGWLASQTDILAEDWVVVA